MVSCDLEGNAGSGDKGGRAKREDSGTPVTVIYTQRMFSSLNPGDAKK